MLTFYNSVDGIKTLPEKLVSVYVNTIRILEVIPPQNAGQRAKLLLYFIKTKSACFAVNTYVNDVVPHEFILMHVMITKHNHRHMGVVVCVCVKL